MIKQILGVIAGYAIFVITSLALFTFSGQKSHSKALINFIILTALYGVTALHRAAFSIISGLISQLIARTGTLSVNYVPAFIMAGFGDISFIKVDGSHY